MKRASPSQLLLLLLMSTCLLLAPAAGNDYCLRETVNITCQPDEVILMTSAHYGRMRGGRCIRAEAGNVGCSTEVMSQLDDACSGKQHCMYPVANLLQHKPCPDDYTPYLETHHTCLKASQSRCLGPEGVIMLMDQDGFIPLSTHSPKCPWRINVDTLQTLRFTLYSFSQRKVQPDVQICPWSVMLEEGGRVIEHTLCHVTSRETTLYTSKSSSVVVRVSYKQNVVLPVAFFLKYEAVGCPQLKVSGNVWVRQDESKATVKCNHTEETWFLACSNRQWHGDVGNCSKALSSEVSSTDSISNVSKSSSLPFGFMIAVVIGVLLGIVIGAIPLALVYLCLKRKWRRQPPSCYITEDPYYPGIQQTLVESNTGSVYPALLKRSTNHVSGTSSPKTDEDGSRTVGQCCYSHTEPFLYNMVTSTAAGVISPPHSWDKQTVEANSRQMECCRIIECPDVMAHTVTAVHGGLQGHAASAAAAIAAGETKGKVRPEHVYESAGFCKTRLAGGALENESIPSDFMPIYYGSEAVHCYIASKPDQFKKSKQNANELKD